jgi:hypothetical protein
MPFTFLPFRRFPAECGVTYNGSLFQEERTVWNPSYTGWRLSGYHPRDQELPFR